MKALVRESQTVRISGERYVRYSREGLDVPAIMLHEQCVDEMRFVDQAIASARAPAAVWEVVWTNGNGNTTSRLLVPNGWIVKHQTPEGDALCFVPDARNQWKTKIEKTM